MKNNEKKLLPLNPEVIWVCLLLVLTFVPVSARMVFQIMPTVNISEEYSDNYLKTNTNKQEEFITSYGLGFSLGFLDQNKKVFLNYSPTYRDYKNLNDRDRLQHIVSIEAEFKPTKQTQLEADLHYDGNSDNYQGDRRESTASLSGKTQIKKHTDLTYSHNYSQRFEEQLRTGAYKEHTINTTMAGVSHRYGKKDVLDVTFIYESDVYEIADDDGYKKVQPFATVQHWFTPKNGLEANLAYLNKDFDDDLNDLATYSGHLRYIKNVSKNLDLFAKYRHSYSDTQAYTHQIYHPSVGVDWDITDDSGITLGLGVLFHDWSNENDDSTDPFIDLDAFKRFEFSPRTSLILTGSSDYSNSGDTASSLGYNTNYRVGAVFSHQLFKQLQTNVFGSFRRAEFYETLVDRKDNYGTIGAGLSWTPLQWLRIGLNYSFTDYQTSSSSREDYRDNRVFFSIGLIPEQPIRPDREITRQSFDDRLFDRGDSWRSGLDTQ